MEGGELLDQGRYGCIFKPSLKCKDPSKDVKFKDDNYHSTITKLSTTRIAQQEYPISKLVSEIPLYRNYFSIFEGMCEPAKIQPEKELKYCEVLHGQDMSNFRILFTRYNGLDLSKYNFNVARFDFKKMIVHLLEAGALLNLFSIVHRDLHSGNILIDKYDVIRIIDFNLSIPVNSNITNDLLGISYNLKISQEPPDSVLVNAPYNMRNPYKTIKKMVYTKVILKKIKRVLGISELEMLRSLYEFLAISKSVKEGNLTGWFKSYWRKIDSWGIGVLLVEIIDNLSSYSDFGIFLKQNKSTLYPMLRKMCAVNPRDRIDCVQALNMMAPDSYIIRKYAKPWLDKVTTSTF
jgi:serine/threonine protein kinase